MLNTANHSTAQCQSRTLGLVADSPHCQCHARLRISESPSKDPVAQELLSASSGLALAAWLFLPDSRFAPWGLLASFGPRIDNFYRVLNCCILKSRNYCHSNLNYPFSLSLFSLYKKPQMLSYWVRSSPDRNTPTMSERYVTSSHLCAVPIQGFVHKLCRIFLDLAN